MEDPVFDYNMAQWLVNPDDNFFDMDYSLTLPPGCFFDDKENIDPAVQEVRESPCSPFYIPPSPPPPQPTMQTIYSAAAQRAPLHPINPPVSSNNSSSNGLKQHKRPLSIKQVLDELTIHCGLVVSFAWPGFTFFQLTPLVDFFRLDPPTYKYPIEAFAEILAYKDSWATREGSLKKFRVDGGTGMGFTRQFYGMQNVAHIVERYRHESGPMDFTAMVSTVGRNGTHMVMLYDKRGTGIVRYDITRFLCWLAGDSWDDIPEVLGLGRHYLGPELHRRMVHHVYTGANGGTREGAFGDPYVVSFYALLLCALRGMDFREINALFYFLSPLYSDIWQLACTVDL